MIDRDVEEALDLAGMQVHGNDAGNTGSRHQISNQFGCNRFTAAGLAILTCITIIRNNGGNVFSRSAFEGICHDEQFHQGVIGRLASRLDDEYVLTADTFVDHDLDFTIVEFANKGFAQFQTEVIGNFLGQFRIGIPRKNLQLFPVFVTHSEPPCVSSD